jgi:chitinase
MDTDSYEFTVPPGAGPTSISVTPAATSNLDVKATLYDATMTEVAVSDPRATKIDVNTVTGLDASIEATLAPGDYTLVVDGVGVPGSYIDYGSIGSYTVNAVTGALPVVVPGAGWVVEGNSGTRTLTVPVTLSEPSSQTVTVDWETIDSLAQPQAGVDFESASGTVTFLPGETSGTASFTVYGDTLDENMLWNAEWGGLLFHTPTNATIGAGLGAVGFALIVDDDPPPTIITTVAGVLEGDVGDTTLMVRFQLSAPSGQTVSVNWATVDSAAQPQAGVDYAPGSGTLTFAPGETSKSVPFVVHGDTVREPGTFYNAEWGSIQLSSPTNAVFGSGPLARIGLALIIDDD